MLPPPRAQRRSPLNAQASGITVSTEHSAPNTEHYPKGVWATLREAMRGSPIDYTTAPVGRAVVMLAVPMVMEMAMESIFRS